MSKLLSLIDSGLFALIVIAGLVIETEIMVALIHAFEFLF